MNGRRRQNYFFILLLTLLLFIGSTRNAFAYIDPGMGYIFQLLIAGLLGILFTIKSYWLKIKSHFMKLIAKEDSSDNDW